MAYSPIELYFSVFIDFTWVPGIPLYDTLDPSVTIGKDFTLLVTLEASRPYSTDLPGQKPPPPAILYRMNQTYSLSCYNISSSTEDPEEDEVYIVFCNTIVLLIPKDYSAAYEAQTNYYDTWTLTVAYENYTVNSTSGEVVPSTPLPELGTNLSYTFQSPTTSIRYAQISVRAILNVITLCVVTFYYRELLRTDKAHGKHRKPKERRCCCFASLPSALPEQLWIFGGFASLFLFQNPFFPFLVTRQLAIWKNLSVACTTMAMAGLCTYWLTIVDASNKGARKNVLFKQNARKARKMKSSHQTLKTLERVATSPFSSSSPSSNSYNDTNHSSPESTSPQKILKEPLLSPAVGACASSPISSFSSCSSSPPLASTSRAASLSHNSKTSAVTIHPAALHSSSLSLYSPSSSPSKHSEIEGNNRHHLPGADSQYRYPLSFYLPKLLFFLLSFICFTSISVILNEVQTQYDSSSGEVLSSSSFRDINHSRILIMYFMACCLCAFILVIYFIYKFLRGIYKSNDRLKRLPYLAYRYRHLSFRVSTFEASCIVLYSLWITGVTVYLAILEQDVESQYYGNSELDRTGSISTCLLASYYIYTLGFIFLPVSCRWGQQQQQQQQQLQEQHQGFPKQEEQAKNLGTPSEEAAALLLEVHAASSEHDTSSSSHHYWRSFFFSAQKEPNPRQEIKTFRLWMACHLVPFAWQTYFNPPLPPRLDYDRLQTYDFPCVKTMAVVGAAADSAVGKEGREEKGTAQLEEDLQTKEKDQTNDEAYIKIEGRILV